jgi:hypothetical protein
MPKAKAPWLHLSVMLVNDRCKIPRQDEPEVMNAVADDAIEEFFENTLAADPANNDAADDDEPEPMEVDVDESDLLSFLEAQEALRKLSISAEKLGVPTEATVHLDRFAKALQSAKANKPKRDSTLHSYFTKKN